MEAWEVEGAGREGRGDDNPPPPRLSSGASVLVTPRKGQACTEDLKNCGKLPKHVAQEFRIFLKKMNCGEFL